MTTVDYNLTTNWYAIHAKPRRESLASVNLEALGLEILLPRVIEVQSSRGCTNRVIKPLFPGYFFARFCPGTCLQAVRFAHGVLGVVSAGTFPVPLDDDIILAIRARIASDGYAKLEPPIWTPGARVEVEEGPFRGFIGRFEREWDDGKRVLILLEAIQQARALVEKRWLRLVCAA